LPFLFYLLIRAVFGEISRAGSAIRSAGGSQLYSISRGFAFRSRIRDSHRFQTKKRSCEGGSCQFPAKLPSRGAIFSCVNHMAFSLNPLSVILFTPALPTARHPGQTCKLQLKLDSILNSLPVEENDLIFDIEVDRLARISPGMFMNNPG
jgi:hypothetical protein